MWAKGKRLFREAPNEKRTSSQAHSDKRLFTLRVDRDFFDGHFSLWLNAQNQAIQIWAGTDVKVARLMYVGWKEFLEYADNNAEFYGFDEMLKPPSPPIYDARLNETENNMLNEDPVAAREAYLDRISRQSREVKNFNACPYRSRAGRELKDANRPLTGLEIICQYGPGDFALAEADIRQNHQHRTGPAGCTNKE